MLRGDRTQSSVDPYSYLIFSKRFHNIHRDDPDMKLDNDGYAIPIFMNSFRHQVAGHTKEGRLMLNLHRASEYLLQVLRRFGRYIFKPMVKKELFFRELRYVCCE